jgi:flagellar biogenesis protein FliO
VSPVASYLIETSVTLLGVIVVAGILLYGAKRRGLSRASGPLDLIGRLPLDGQRAVYLVRIGGTVYVIGASEAGLTKIGELPESEVGPLPEPARGALADVIRRALGGAGANAVAKSGEREHAD